MKGENAMRYLFFYDESEHSRKITQKTVNAHNFALDFVAVVIGYTKSISEKIENDYSVIEEKYRKVFCVDELKSTIISKKKYKNGFASFNKNDIDLIEDIIDFCLSKNLKIYVTIQNKIYYLIVQILNNYHTSLFFDADAMTYSVTKLICMYKPQEVIDAIYKKDISFVVELKKFCLELLSHNGNAIHKGSENELLKQLLILLEKSNFSLEVDWQYENSFYGFKKYLIEQSISDYELLIDKEGNGATNRAAQIAGINSQEADSKNYVGIRIADFIAGLVSRFIIAIQNDISYADIEDNKNLKYLNDKWFDIDERRFKLYKKLRYLIVNQNNSWDKLFCSLYADEATYLISLLNYIANYKSYNDFIECTMHKEYVNTCAVNDLKRHFELMSNKLSIDPISIEDDTYINQKGAVCYKDFNKHKYLLIDDKERTYQVLSVGFFGKMEKACVTIQENGESTVYLLPNSLLKWAVTCVAFANKGENLFPSTVRFIKRDGRDCADIL